MLNRHPHRHGFPTFFKVFFGFILVMVLSVFAFVGYQFISYYSNPDAYLYEQGRRMGEFYRGVNDAVGYQLCPSADVRCLPPQ